MISCRNAAQGRLRPDDRSIRLIRQPVRLVRSLSNISAMAAVVITLLLASVSPVRSQEDSARSLIKSEVLQTRGTTVSVYPFAYYTPELRFAFGAGGIISFYTNDKAILRPSKISLSGYYATSGQYNVSLAPQVYLRENLLFISSKIFFGHKTYYTPLRYNPELNATSYGIYAEIRLGKAPPALDPMNFTDLTQWAFIADYEYVSLADESGFESLPSHNLGLGLARVWDSRDNIFYPLKGRLLRAEALFFSRAFASSFDFNRYRLDLRWYQAVNAERRQVFAMQLYGEYAGGQPPLYQLPALGGSGLMRGYKSGVQRDRLLVAGQAEYRAHLWWRLGAAVFAGIGEVASGFGDLGWRSLKPSYGGGLRILFNRTEGVNLRADFGFGADSSGLYFAIEEAF